jgi:hypothetical protein
MMAAINAAGGTTAINASRAGNAGRTHEGYRQALVSAAERVGVDEEWVLRKLRMNAVMAMRAGDRAAANRSIELIGKHLGMFIERKQIDIAYVDDADEYLAKIMALVDSRAIDHEPAPLAIDYEMAEDDDSVH